VLEEIGKNDDANFHPKLNKTEDDNNYKKALDCLRRHLRVIECVLSKMYNRYRLDNYLITYVLMLRFAIL